MTSQQSILNRWDFRLFLICILVFAAFPELDIWAAHWFYSAGEGFYLKQNSFVRFIYLVFAKIHLVFLVIFLLMLVLPKVKALKTRLPVYDARKIKFLLLALVLGPGLLVNAILKDNSTGRARPSQIQEFGGAGTFTSPFVMANQCKRNCSFVSGHASMGFYLMAFAWAFRSRRVLAAGVGMGVLVGAVRMIQGGHFLSDVIFAGWAVYWVCQGLGRYYHLSFTRSPPEPATSH